LQGSQFNLLSMLYPEHKWLPWKFQKSNYWDTLKNQKQFMDWAGNELGIKKMEDWYKINTYVYIFQFLLEFIK
jgi:hypothetical protein